MCESQADPHWVFGCPQPTCARDCRDTQETCARSYSLGPILRKLLEVFRRAPGLGFARRGDILELRGHCPRCTVNESATSQVYA